MDQTTPPPPSTAQPSTGMRILGWLGLALMLVVGFQYLGTGLVAPPWVYAIIIPLWLVLFWIALRNLRRRPLVSFLMPFAAVLAWVAIVTLGDVFLGWTA